MRWVDAYLATELDVGGMTLASILRDEAQVKGSLVPVERRLGVATEIVEQGRSVATDIVVATLGAREQLLEHSGSCVLFRESERAGHAVQQGRFRKGLDEELIEARAVEQVTSM